MPTTIYALRDPRTGAVKYVGKTCVPLHFRVEQHLRRTALTETHCARWLRSLIALGLKPSSEVLEVVPDERWRAAERYWIAYHRGRHNLCNISDGGDGGRTPGFHQAPETRAKMARTRRALAAAGEPGGTPPSFLGKTHSAEVAARIGAAAAARRPSPEARERMRSAQQARRQREKQGA